MSITETTEVTLSCVPVADYMIAETDRQVKVEVEGSEKWIPKTFLKRTSKGQITVKKWYKALHLAG